ncbi:MAG: PAS domain-containing protein [Polaromonas sp.]|nr:PAS domain-containing protein [Polaromonas sp.]
MKETQKAAPHAASVFQSGGGEMGVRVRAFDWAATPLGAIESWPAALRITVDQMLASKFPACLFWGPDLIAVYNDGYRELLGKKPEALGEPMRVTWAEVWSDLQPIAEKALAGESTFIENFRITPDRDGSQQDAWFTFNYGPVFDENGVVVGMLDTVMETTAQVLGERQRREERDRQRNLLQQMPGFAAVLTGPTHVFDYVNDAYRELAGERAFIGRPVREVFPELADQGFFEMLDGVYQTGQPIQASAIPVRLSHGRGERFVDLLYTPIRDEHGVVLGIFAGGYDITDRVKAEAGLRELNAELERRVIERTLARGKAWQVSPELLSVINAEGRFETVNPAWQKTLGWSEDDMAGASFRDFVHPDDMDRSIAAWADATERGLPVLRFENRYLVKGGGWRWLSWVAVPEDNKVYCITRDVQDERNDAEMLAQRTAERDVLAGIVENTNTFIQVLDLDFNFLALNTANIDEYERIYGHRPKVGDNLLAMLADRPEQRAAAEALWRRAMNGESFTVQGEFGDAVHARRHYEMKFEVLRGDDGKQVAAFMSGTDITERLNEHRALLDTQEALRHAQKMEAVGQLTGGIAHDFNNLLAGIGGSLQVMQKRLKSGKLDGLERYLDMSESSVRRAAALTHRLLAFSRRQTLDPKPVDVNRLTSGMAELIRRTVGPSVELEVHSADDLWPTQVDPSQLENALLNLCINARDAMLPGGGCLTITSGNRSFTDREAAARELPAGDYVCLAVTDTGAGMSPEVITRIFDPFYTTKPMGQGTGLGLSMVYGFVRQSGGRVEADSRVGYGTTMRIFLPRFSGETSEEARIAAAEAAGAGDGETVLLIEDEEIVRDVIREVLTEAGYRVLVASDGPTGLHILQADGRIDLLLTDVGLPGGMNGRQVADAGRVVRPGLKVLFITGYAENAAVGNGVMEHGMQVMTKPFEIEDLSQKVRDMLDGG